jgi:hypothetical protein
VGAYEIEKRFLCFGRANVFAGGFLMPVKNFTEIVSVHAKKNVIFDAKMGFLRHENRYFF